MKMKSCVVVACRDFNNETHQHFICIMFQMMGKNGIHGEVVQWDNPSTEIVKMMLYHSKTAVVYRPCNQ